MKRATPRSAQVGSEGEFGAFVFSTQARAQLAEARGMDRKPIRSASVEAEINRQKIALSDWLQLKKGRPSL